MSEPADPSPDRQPAANDSGDATRSREPSALHHPCPVVGIGGSAGALPALLRFFEALPVDSGMAFVVVVHLSPDHESHISEILGRATPMPVVQVDRPDGT